MPNDHHIFINFLKRSERKTDYPGFVLRYANRISHHTIHAVEITKGIELTHLLFQIHAVKRVRPVEIIIQ